MMNSQQIAYIIGQFRDKRIIVAGDTCTDRWLFGTMHRASPEAPVPILLQDKETWSPGMAGLVAGMVQALGARSTLVSLDERSKCTKTRILARIPGREYQQVCRIDDEDDVAMNDATADVLIAQIDAEAGKSHAIVVADYSKGIVTNYLCKAIRQIATRHSIPVLADPGRGADWKKYRGMVVKANEHEWREQDWSGFEISSSAFSDMFNCVGVLGLSALIVTMGGRGIDLATSTGISSRIPGRAVDGFDVAGAGDQCAAVIGLCMACGVPLGDACELADVAGRMQVQRQGCVPVTSGELMEETSRSCDNVAS